MNGTMGTSGDSSLGGNLRNNLISTTAGYIGYGAAQWAMIIALARLAKPEAVGQFTLAFAITAPLFVIFDMQLRRIVASDTDKLISAKTVLMIRGYSCAVSVGVVALLSFFLHFDSTQVQLNLLVASAKAFESTSDVLYGYFQQFEKMHFIAISLWVKGIGALGSLAIVLWRTQSIVFATAAMSAWWCVVLISFDLPRTLGMLRLVSPGTRNGRSISVSKLTKMAGSLGIAMSIGSLGQNIPRYYIESWCGSAELGVYSAASYFFVIGSRLASATADAILPHVSRLRDSSPGTLMKVLLRATVPLVLTGAVLALVAMPLSGPILKYIYGPKYAAGANIVIMMCVASSINCAVSMFQVALIALRRLHSQILIVSVGTVVCLALSMILIERFRGTGAAMALTLGLAVQAVMAMVMTSKECLRRERAERAEV